MTGVNLNKTKLINTVMTVTSSNLTGSPISDSYRVTKGFLIGPTVNLTGADLSGQSLQNCQLKDATLVNTNFERGNLENCALTGSNIDGAKLLGAKLNKVHTSQLVNQPASLPNGWQLANGYLIGSGADLTGAPLGGLNLQGMDFSESILSGVSSRGIIGQPRLPSKWTLLSGYLIGPGANLAGADLSGINISKSTLTGISSGGVITTGTTLPLGWTQHNGYLVGPTAILTNADLSNLDLSNLSLSGANLENANLSGTNFENTHLEKVNLKGARVQGANFTNSKLAGAFGSSIIGTPVSMPSYVGLRSGKLIGPLQNHISEDLGYLDFTGFDLSGSTYLNANLSYTTLTGTNLTGVSLGGANLSGVKSGQIRGIPNSLPTGWKLVSGFLIGNGARLTSANIDKADLKSANLAGVWTNELTGIPKSLPKGWRMTLGYLVGRGAPMQYYSLQGGNLAGLDLSGMDLSRASYSGVNLSGAKLKGTNLTGADLSNANLTGADLSNANLTDANLSGANLQTANLSGSTVLRTNIARSRMLGAKLDCSAVSKYTGIPDELPSCWTNETGQLRMKAQPGYSQLPWISGSPFTDLFQSNYLTIMPGRSTGTPTPVTTHKWYLCSKAVNGTGLALPSFCKLLSNETANTVRVLLIYKGKYVALRSFSTNGFGKDLVTFSSTEKIQ